MQRISRRDFLKQTGNIAGSAWVGAQLPLLLALGQTACNARDEGGSLGHFTGREAKELAAIAERIIPETETPGATTTGVIYFIDVALDGFMAGAEEFLRRELAAFLQNNDGKFSSLPRSQQVAALRKIEQGQFFQTMRFLTVCGMFCMPARGGNRDHAGWALLQFDYQHAWQAPFGYYDGREGNENA